jgi:hypothetical protein
MSGKSLVFPEDVAVGALWVGHRGEAVYQGPARGTLIVPADAVVHLEACSPLRGLYELAPDALQSVHPTKKLVTDEDLQHLSHLTGLRSLDCSKGHKITDAGVAHLRDMVEMRRLDLYWSAVTDAALSSLTRMAHLEYLHLGLTRIKGPGLARLVALQRLQVLNLENTDVDDAALPYLARQQSLRKLILWGTRVSVRGLKDLQAVLPGTEVWMKDPGRRLAQERMERGVLRILLRRVRPELPADVDPMEHLHDVIPKGSKLAQWRRCAGAPAYRIGIPLDDTYTMARVLGRCAGDIRIVTPDGRDFWIPWLRKRGSDRRRSRRRGEGERRGATEMRAAS